MKKLFLIWVLIFGVVGLGFAQTQKTLVKTFAVDEDCPFALFALKGNVEVFAWDKATIRITTTITAPDIEEKVLDVLVKKGRYGTEMRVHREAQLMIFEMPKQEQFIFINGLEIEETLEFEIFVPRGVLYRVVEHQLPVIM